MNITILDFDDIKNPLLGAGQARATLEVGKRLTQKDHEITVISSRYPGYQDRVENGITYRHIGLGSKHIKINNIFYILCLPFAVRKIKADVIVECFTGPISTLFSPLFTKIPVVAVSTSFDAEMHSKHYHLPFYLIERFGVKFYKYFLPYTQAYDAKMKKHNNRVISQVTAEGVSDEFFQIKKMSPKYILSIGRFDIAQKGLDLLIRAYAKIKDEIPYPLIVAGRGPDEAKIKKLIVKLNLQQKVFIKPPAFGNEKSRLLSESVFVVLPSKFETFSGFALEAMASGSPLVIFDIPGLKWISEKCCFRAKPYDENEYADLMLKACNIPETLRQMGVDAKIFAKQFSWDDVAAKYDNFLNLVINKYEK